MMLLIEKYHLETAVSKPCNMRVSSGRRERTRERVLMGLWGMAWDTPI
jgi:hypothetical protein